MTDKALEAVLLPCPFCGGEAHIVKRDVEPQGDPWYGKRNEKFVECPKCSACVFDGYWHEGFIEDEQAIAAWNRRAPLSALPGEAEVVGKQIAEARLWLSTLGGSDAFAVENLLSQFSVTLASLQAMQARAEKAERERGEAYNKGYSARDEVVSACRSRAEAAEARVKELEEGALLLLSEIDAPNGIDWIIRASQRLRTALKGGSNG